MLGAGYTKKELFLIHRSQDLTCIRSFRNWVSSSQAFRHDGKPLAIAALGSDGMTTWELADMAASAALKPDGIAIWEQVKTRAASGSELPTHKIGAYSKKYWVVEGLGSATVT